jgi:hypothetical protein
MIVERESMGYEGGQIWSDRVQNLASTFIVDGPVLRKASPVTTEARESRSSSAKQTDQKLCRIFGRQQSKKKLIKPKAWGSKL